MTAPARRLAGNIVDLHRRLVYPGVVEWAGGRIRRLSFNRDSLTVLVEYDATRLNGAMVAGLLRRAGLEITEEMPLLPPPDPAAAEALAAPAKA